jgi:DNA helicase HerA-like ATPase
MMTGIFLGSGGPEYDRRRRLLLRQANRHGLVAGATGTGKTITLQIMAESFSAQGVPVFLADVKGDLSGLAAAGSPAHKHHEKLIGRAEKIGFADYGYEETPTIFWDVFGEKGHPIRARIGDIGPVILSRMLDLNAVQEGVLNVVFRAAEDDDLPLIDLKDLRSMLTEVAERAKELAATYGSVSRASVGAIQRRLLVLENQGADTFFGEPALDINDLMRTTNDGRGVVSVLAADKLMRSPRLYATFLFWLLSKLFAILPEIGDPDKPKLAFFFDEAHLLFDDAPDALIDQVEQVARLIRSKGVGVYFVTQNPADVPDTILGQLGNRVQHALRAYTPRDQRALRAAAQTFRPNPEFDSEDILPQLGVGEALVSTLDEKSVPTVVERTLIRPPSSQIGPISDAERKRLIAISAIAGLYDTVVDDHSAYEKLAEKRAHAAAAAAQELERKAREEEARAGTKKASTRRRSQSSMERAVDRSLSAFLRRITQSIGRRLAKAVFNALIGGRR